jgi:hypothetical protein
MRRSEELKLEEELMAGILGFCKSIIVAGEMFGA